MLIDRLIHKKTQQVTNKLYSLKARKAIEYEIGQLKEINEVHRSNIAYLREENSRLTNELKASNQKIFHFELLVVALMQTSPMYLGFYLNIYTIPFLLAYFKGTTITQQNCKIWETDINLVRKAKGLSEIDFNNTIRK